MIESPISQLCMYTLVVPMLTYTYIHSWRLCITPKLVFLQRSIIGCDQAPLMSVSKRLEREPGSTARLVVHVFSHYSHGTWRLWLKMALTSFLTVWSGSPADLASLWFSHLTLWPVICLWIQLWGTVLSHLLVCQVTSHLSSPPRAGKLGRAWE